MGVDTLEELKAVILRNMGVAGGTSLVRRVRASRSDGAADRDADLFNADVGGPSSSARGPADVIPCSPIHCAAPGAAMQLEMNSDEGSDEDFVSDTGVSVQTGFFAPSTGLDS
ncbi:hypothetical protein PIB30_077462 [Stylosanthes scabra]|uniref:Uncharacterized protein n=1 Tax=Stylosanthes scabra TaxID=79078 RepID=A0ABU6URB0_9FABA|nr:hypothetical protein [Stylosanthes scabra]